MDHIWEQLQAIAENYNGILTTKQVEAAGISRTVLKKYVDVGLLSRTCKGLYTLTDDLPDEYVLLQARNKKAVFSYGTALYFWDLSDRTPHTLDLSVPQGSNVSRLKRDNPYVRIHHVQPELFELGRTETKSPQGGTIRLYDRERCICDLIRDKKKMDLQLYTQAVKDYFRMGADSRKLLKYGRQFHIEEKIRTYMEVLL